MTEVQSHGAVQCSSGSRRCTNPRNQRSLSREFHAKGGSTKPRLELRDTSGTEFFSVAWCQAGPGAGLAPTVAPTSHLTKTLPHLFRAVLLRRFRLPLLLSLHSCQCGRQIDPFGHNRAA